MAKQQQSETKKPLSVEDMLNADDTKYIEVAVPEWSGTVRLGSLPAGDMLEWAEANEGKARRTAGLRLLIKSLVDAEGNRIGKPEMIERFRTKSHIVINRLVEQILELNNLQVVTGKEAQKAAGEGSGEADGDASPSVLH